MPKLKELIRRAVSSAKPAAPSADGPAEPEPKAKVCLGAAYDSRVVPAVQRARRRGAGSRAAQLWGNADGSTDRKEAGFRQLGGFYKIDRDAHQKFARMTDGQKTAKARGCGRAATTSASP